jgi:hypothetical protein
VGWGVGVDGTGAVDEDKDIGVTECTSLGLVIYIGIMHT